MVLKIDYITENASSKLRHKFFSIFNPTLRQILVALLLKASEKRVSNSQRVDRTKAQA